jgi:hypothetical protein
MDDPSVCTHCGGLWFSHFPECVEITQQNEDVVLSTIDGDSQWEDVSEAPSVSVRTAGVFKEVLPLKAGNCLRELEDNPPRLSRADREWLERLEDTIREHILVDSFNIARRCVFCNTHIENHQAQCREVDNKIGDIMIAIAAQLE